MCYANPLARAELLSVYNHHNADLFKIRDTVTKYSGDLRFADVRYRIPSKLPATGEAFVTATLITANRGAFIKIPFTPMSEENRHQHPIVDAFIKDLAEVLAV